jgi:hypothetical protein
LAYDSRRHKRVIIASVGDVYGFIQVWEWEGTNWVVQSTQPDPLLTPDSGAPSKLGGEAITYHAGRGQVIINNGSDPFGYRRWTWGYDGTSWQRLSIEDGPQAEASGQMVYDTARNALVQFGGADNIGFVSGRTWELVDADHIEILKQPLSVGTVSNRLVQFSVTVRGVPPLRYQWRKDGVTLTDGGRISGAATGTLTITNANRIIDTGAYEVEVSNDCGALTSNAAHLGFLPLRITGPPAHPQLSWEAGNAALEWAPEVTGPWSGIPGATSPFPVVPDQARRFFRLR